MWRGLVQALVPHPSPISKACGTFTGVTPLDLLMRQVGQSACPCYTEGLLTQSDQGGIIEAQALLCHALHVGWQLGVWSSEPLCGRWLRQGQWGLWEKR